MRLKFMKQKLKKKITICYGYHFKMKKKWRQSLFFLVLLLISSIFVFDIHFWYCFIVAATFFFNVHKNLKIIPRYIINKFIQFHLHTNKHQNELIEC